MFLLNDQFKKNLFKTIEYSNIKTHYVELWISNHIVKQKVLLNMLRASEAIVFTQNQRQGLKVV